MTLKEGQLRMWISRDSDGGVHESYCDDPIFVVVKGPYENSFGQKMVDLLEGGQVFEFIDANHTEHWSTVIGE